MYLRSRSALIVTILFATAMGYYHLVIFLPQAQARRATEGLAGGYSFGNDFYPIWLTSREWLLHDSLPYSPDTTRAIQKGLFGRALDSNNPADPPANYREFSYPIFVDILAAPLARLHFPIARIILAVLLPFLTTGGVVLWLRALRFRMNGATFAILILLTMSSYPVLEALFAEQMGVVAGFLLAASLLALAEGRLAVAGCLLAFTTIKPQMTILLVFYLLLWTLSNLKVRRRFAYGLAAGVAVLCVPALLIWPHWISQWLHVLLGYRGYSTPPLAIDLLGLYGGVALSTILLAAAIAFAWRMRRVSAASGEFYLTSSILLSVTVVVLMPGHAVYDHIVLLPGIIFIVRFWREFIPMNHVFRLVLALAAAAILWQWLAALGIVAMHIVLGASHPLSLALVLLPVRTAASIPFTILALLGLSAREVIRGRLVLSG